MLETKKHCKLDDKKAELYTIEECYKKVGSFPFTVMKMKNTNKLGCVFVYPMFTTVTIEEWESTGFIVRGDEMYKLEDSRSWILLK